MSDREQSAASRFGCGPSERACFEAGIKLATVYHQFVGTPFCERNREELEKAIAGCILTQPYVSGAEVHIVADGGDKGDQYSYASLTGDMIDAVVTVRIDGTEAVAEMRYDPELGYPLMFISSVNGRKKPAYDILFKYIECYIP